MYALRAHRSHQYSIGITLRTDNRVHSLRAPHQHHERLNPELHLHNTKPLATSHGALDQKPSPFDQVRGRREVRRACACACIHAISSWRSGRCQPSQPRQANHHVDVVEHVILPPRRRVEVLLHPRPQRRAPQIHQHPRYLLKHVGAAAR